MISPFFKGAVNTMTGIGEKSGAASTEVVKKVQDVSIARSNFFKGILSFDRQLIRLAGLSGAIAVGLGAYGSHGKAHLRHSYSVTYELLLSYTISSGNDER